MKKYHNIAILSVKKDIGEDIYLKIKAQFKDAKVTLISPKSSGDWAESHQEIEHWHDGDRTGFLKLLTIARRMSWCSFDCVVKVGDSFKDKTLLALLLPKAEVKQFQSFSVKQVNQ